MNIILSAILLISALTKTEFYDALATDNEQVLEKVYLQTQKAPFTEEKGAYLGVILMKQAGFKFLPTKKLSLFIEGKNLLENAIAKHPKNVEMKLLRLMIQENAPRFLGYSDNCTKDAAYVKKMYPTLTKELQKIVEGYAKKSAILNL